MLTHNFAKLFITDGNNCYMQAKNWGGVLKLLSGGGLIHNGLNGRNYFSYVWGTDGVYGNRSSYDTHTWFIDVGFEDTEPTKEDYKLADGNALRDTPPLTCNAMINGRATSASPIPWTNTELMKGIANFMNTSESAVTVKEIGIYLYCDNTRNQVYPNTMVFLIARSVLDTPVTIQPGESYTFTYAITI